MTQSIESQISQPLEREFHVNGLKIAAKEWHSGATVGAIALHGWLDNANSFDMLAPLLPELNIYALDCAGHGKSDFRSEDSPYLIWSDVAEVIGVANQLSLDKFVLIAHSRGANMASIIAGTFPDRISHLVLIEGGLPSCVDPADTPQQFAQGIVADNQVAGTKGTLFPSHDRAVSARAEGFIGVELNTAETLAKRSLLEEDGGYRWRADSRLKTPSCWKLTEEQRQAFLSRITMPTLLIEATRGLTQKMELDIEPLLNVPTLENITIEGDHHLHMEGAESEIAKHIRDWLN